MSTAATKSSVNTISNRLKSTSDLNPEKDPQGVMNFVATSCSLLNTLQSNEALSPEEGQNIRSNMVDLMSKIVAKTLPEVTQKSQALGDAIANKHEVNNEAQVCSQ